MENLPDEADLENKSEETPVKNSGVSIPQAMLIVLIAIVLYHVFITSHYNANSGCKVYTTNAESIQNLLYQKVMNGKMKAKMFQRIISNMEEQIQTRINGQDNVVILSDRAIITGGEKIVFDTEGFIQDDPDKAVLINDEIREAVEKGQDADIRTLQEAIKAYRNEVKE